MKPQIFKTIAVSGVLAATIPCLCIASQDDQKGTGTASAEDTQNDAGQPGVPPSAKTSPDATTPNSGSGKSSWNDHFFKDFQEIQGRMDRLFREAWDESGAAKPFKGGNEFSSSVQMSEKDGAYVVWIALPERDAKAAEAKIESGNILHVTAKEEPPLTNTPSTPATEENGGTSPKPQPPMEKSHFEQMIELPGPVDASKLKLDREPSSVTITIPKATGQPQSKSPE